MKTWSELKTSIVFECDDIEDTYESLKARGVEFLDQPRKEVWGTFAMFRDPDGNEFVLTG